MSLQEGVDALRAAIQAMAATSGVHSAARNKIEETRRSIGQASSLLSESWQISAIAGDRLDAVSRELATASASRSGATMRRIWSFHDKASDANVDACATLEAAKDKLADSLLLLIQATDELTRSTVENNACSDEVRGYINSLTQRGGSQ